MLTRMCSAAGAALVLASASSPVLALTFPQPSPLPAASAERVWWDGSGRWRADHAAAGFRPAQPYYHCWRPLHGPLRCQWDY